MTAPPFPRADPEALAQFDPNTRQCTMNCGQTLSDPRSSKERKFLCTECFEVVPLIRVSPSFR